MLPRCPWVKFSKRLTSTTFNPRKSRNYGTIEPTNEKLSLSSGSSKEVSRHENRHFTMISMTRGSPSTSIDLKEAVREKIPLHYDLLRKFRAQYGSEIVSKVTVNDLYEGLKDVNALVRETSEFDSEHGIRYRGLTLPEVLVLLPRRGNGPSPEAIFWLLLTGDVPSHEQTSSLVADWSLRRQRQKNWWLDSTGNDSFLCPVIRNLPKNIGPLGKLSIALTALNDSDKNPQKLDGPRTVSYSDWEDTYEEGMELLAALPAIVGLTRSKEITGNPKEVDGDWVDFFLDRSGLLSDTIDPKNKASLGDFLRLYIVANADEEGGMPSTHVTQILGASPMELSKTLASGLLVHRNEPSTGTLLQCMKFQEKVESLLGKEPNEEALNNIVGAFFERDNEVIGHKEAAVCDTRYTAFSDFARERINQDPGIKLSRNISRMLISMSRSSDKSLWPEQGFLAAPIFRFYGLRDMEFNQALLWMSRALGTVASIIWTKAVDIPIEHPKSRCTHTYFDSFREKRKKI